MTEDESRAEFVRLISAPPYEYSNARYSDAIGGEYIVDEVQVAWELWQEAMAYERKRCLKREWLKLTNEEISSIASLLENQNATLQRFARAIESELKERNT